MTKSVIIGTYQIINTLDQKSYVGSSNNIARRWKDHTRDLNNGEHHNGPLQGAWTKYGADVFQFHIIEIADTLEQALQDEQQLLNALFDGGKTCYNTAPDATAPFRGKHHTEGAKEKSRVAQTGKKRKPFTVDHCTAISVAKKGKSTGPFKQDRKDAISVAKKGKKLGPPTQGHKDALKAAWVKRRVILP